MRSALAASVRRLADNENGTLNGRSAEALHQARVAVRRLRSDLRSFRPLVDREWADGLRQELRWLGAELGAVRDLDVLLRRLRRDLKRAGDGADRDAGMQGVLDAVRDARRRKREQLVAAMKSPRYAQLRERLEAAARRPEYTLGARQEAADALPPIVRKNWKRLKRAVEELPARPSMAALHCVRILAKRARYAAEAAEPPIGDAAKRFASCAARLQDVLGEVNDAATACARMRLLRRKPDLAVAALAFTALERDEMARARSQWRDCWEALDRKGLRSWF